MKKKLEEMISCNRQETLNYILAGANIILGAIGAAVSLWYLLLFIPGAFFMCIAIYWGIQYNRIEEEIAKEEDDERKETLAFMDEAIEALRSENLKGWNMHEQK